MSLRSQGGSAAGAAVRHAGVREEELPKIRLHDSTTPTQTLLVAAGEPVSERLGHIHATISSISTAGAGRAPLANPGTGEQIADRFAALLGG
jgi:hypothetical protein